MDYYIIDTEENVAGANKLMFDLYNASPGHSVYLFSLECLTKADVAVTGAVTPRFDLYRTSAVGTSGTTAGYAETGVAKTQINPFDTNQNTIPTGITARSVPTGGATISAYLTKIYAQPEETNAGATIVQNQIDFLTKYKPIVIRPTQGILIKQGSVASVNSYSFRLVIGIKEQL